MVDDKLEECETEHHNLYLNAITMRDHSKQWGTCWWGKRKEVDKEEKSI